MSTVHETEEHVRFTAVVRDVAVPVRRYLIRRTDPATADDVLSDTLAVCWRRVREIPDDDPLPWVYTVARWCLANARRAQRRQLRLVHRIGVVDPPSMGVADPGEDQTDPVLATALARLRDGDAEVLRLWAWEDLSSSQIATVLGITDNAASVRLHRAKARLRELLTAMHDEEDMA